MLSWKDIGLAFSAVLAFVIIVIPIGTFLVGIRFYALDENDHSTQITYVALATFAGSIFGWLYRKSVIKSLPLS